MRAVEVRTSYPTRIRRIIVKYEISPKVTFVSLTVFTVNR